MFLLTDASVWRMIVFIVRRLSRPDGLFGNTQNCVRIVLPVWRPSVNRAGMHSPAFPDRRAINGFASLKLTPREAEVLFWISQGKSNHDIGVILGAKTGTICKHVEHIFAKLNVENRTAAAVVALETCRWNRPTSESGLGRPWTSVAGFVTQLCVLCSDSREFYGEIARLVA